MASSQSFRLITNTEVDKGNSRQDVYQHTEIGIVSVLNKLLT